MCNWYHSIQLPGRNKIQTSNISYTFFLFYYSSIFSQFWLPFLRLTRQGKWKEGQLALKDISSIPPANFIQLPFSFCFSWTNHKRPLGF